VRMRLANSIKIPPEKFNCCRPFYVRLVFQDVPTLTQTLQEKHGDLARVPDLILHPYCNPSRSGESWHRRVAAARSVPFYR
jgi:hypothetical protein